MAYQRHAMQDRAAVDETLGLKEGEGRTGIAIIANDKVMHWLLPFLESWKATNAHLPIHLVPYDDNVARTRRVAELYGARFSDIDCRELDALSKKLYPLSLGKRFRLRKLLSLALPLDEVVYLDVDIILFRDLAPMLGKLEPGKTDFIVICRTTEYVYNRRHADFDYLRDAITFNDGFFITSRKILDVQDFYDAMEVDEATFDTVRQRGGLYAQPLTNFVVHRKRLRVVTAHDIRNDISPETYHKATGVTFGPDGPRDERGDAIYFCHWPGVTGVPRGRVIDDAWHVLSDKAAARVAAAGV